MEAKGQKEHQGKKLKHQAPKEPSWADQIITAAEKGAYDKIAELISFFDTQLISVKGTPENFHALAVLFLGYEAASRLFSEQHILKSNAKVSKDIIASTFYQQITDPAQLDSLYRIASSIYKGLTPKEKATFYDIIFAVFPAEKIDNQKKRDIGYHAYRFFINYFEGDLKDNPLFHGRFTKQLRRFKEKNIDASPNRASQALNAVIERLSQEIKGRPDSPLVTDGRPITPRIVSPRSWGEPEPRSPTPPIAAILGMEPPWRTRTRNLLYILSCIAFFPIAVGEWLWRVGEKLAGNWFSQKTQGDSASAKLIRGLGYLYQLFFKPEELIKASPPKYAKWIMGVHIFAWFFIMLFVSPYLGIPAAGLPDFLNVLKDTLNISKIQFLIAAVTLVGVGMRLLLRWINEIYLPTPLERPPANDSPPTTVVKVEGGGVMRVPTPVPVPPTASRPSSEQGKARILTPTPTSSPGKLVSHSAPSAVSPKKKPQFSSVRGRGRSGSYTILPSGSSDSEDGEITPKSRSGQGQGSSPPTDFFAKIGELEQREGSGARVGADMSGGVAGSLENIPEGSAEGSRGSGSDPDSPKDASKLTDRLISEAVLSDAVPVSVEP